MSKATILILTLLGASLCPTDALAQSAPAAGVRVFVDPDTGEFLDDVRPGFVRPDFPRPGDFDEEPLLTESLPGGATIIHFREHTGAHAVATVGASGAVEMHCHDHVGGKE